PDRHGGLQGKAQREGAGRAPPARVSPRDPAEESLPRRREVIGRGGAASGRVGPRRRRAHHERFAATTSRYSLGTTRPAPPPRSTPRSSAITSRSRRAPRSPSAAKARLSGP